METVYIIWTLLLLGVLAWVTVRGREAWPFSPFPMFSALRRPDSARVLAVAAVRTGGLREFFRSPHVGEEKTVSRLLTAIPWLSAENPAVREILAGLLRRFEDPDSIESLEVLLRRGFIDGDGSVRIEDTVVLTADARSRLPAAGAVGAGRAGS